MEKFYTEINNNGKLQVIEISEFFAAARHCQSKFNRYRLVGEMKNFVGRSESDKFVMLSEEGLFQALKMGKFVNEIINLSGLYTNFVSSTYNRAIETIEPITRMYSQSELLIENGAGDQYGCTQQELKEMIPGFMENRKDRWNFSWGGSETYSSVLYRLRKFIVEQASQNTFIVTHGVPMTIFEYFFESQKGVTLNEYIAGMNNNYSKNGEIREYNFHKNGDKYVRVSSFIDGLYKLGQWHKIES
jgi:broad specificity phosphatase PhoE